MEGFPSIGTLNHFLFMCAIAAIVFSSCTPEGVINKTKYNGEKITNTCETFQEEVQAIIDANSNTAELVVAEYDNSDFPAVNRKRYIFFVVQLSGPVFRQIILCSDDVGAN